MSHTFWRGRFIQNRTVRATARWTKRKGKKTTTKRVNDFNEWTQFAPKWRGNRWCDCWVSLLKTHWSVGGDALHFQRPASSTGPPRGPTPLPAPTRITTIRHSSTSFSFLIAMFSCCCFFCCCCCCLIVLVVFFIPQKPFHKFRHESTRSYSLSLFLSLSLSLCISKFFK